MEQLCHTERCSPSNALKLNLHMTRFLLTADLHQFIPKWEQLVEATLRERPDFLLIAGDLLPKTTHAAQREFFPEMRRHLTRMKDEAGTRVLLYLGNDDGHPLEPLLDELQTDGLCVNLNDRVHREAGFVFCGMNRVRDYPFGYKHWCAPDGDFVVCPEQFGPAVTCNEHCEYVPIGNLHSYLSAQPSLLDRLNALKQQLQPGEMERSIWMVHQPPSGLGMDVCGNGQRVGSPNVLRFIEDHQPLFGLSGHIHESPHQPGGAWTAWVNHTRWFQPGQVTRQLHCVRLEVADRHAIQNVRHSVFGES